MSDRGYIDSPEWRIKEAESKERKRLLRKIVLEHCQEIVKAYEDLGFRAAFYYEVKSKIRSIQEEKEE